MLKIALLVYFILFVVSLLIYKKMSNPIVCFNLIWTVWMVIALIGVTGIRNATSEVYKYFIIGGIVFNIAGFIFITFDTLKYSKKGIRPRCETSLYYYKQLIFSMIQIVILMYYIFEMFDLLSALSSGQTYEHIRGYYYSDENFSSRLEYLVVTYLFDPMVTLAQVVFVINLFDKKKSTPSLTVMLLNVLLRSIISGGRMIVFELAALILLCFLYQYKSFIKYNKSKIYKAVGILCLVLIIVWLISQGRKQATHDESRNIISILFSNFTGSFTYFSVLNGNSIYPPLQYGRAIFAGAIDIFFMATNMIGLTNASLTTNEIGTILSEFYSVGTYSYNAMPSMYYFFISDFGKVGIVIGCIIFAFYAVYAYTRCNHLKTYKSLALYLLMMLVIVESSMTWLPFKISFVITLVYAMIFMSNKQLPSVKLESEI